MGQPVIAVGIAVVAMGCAGSANRPRTEAPARLTLGTTMRHYATVQQPPDEATFRTSEPTPTAVLESQSAYLGSIAFTMMTPLAGIYAGGEVETGVVEPGTSAASVYGVIGTRHALANIVNVGVELVAGRRWLRYPEEREEASFAAEPRVRLDVWLSERITLGGVAGATLGDQNAWMGGLYVGIHSHDFGLR